MVMGVMFGYNYDKSLFTIVDHCQSPIIWQWSSIFVGYSPISAAKMLVYTIISYIWIYSSNYWEPPFLCHWYMGIDKYDNPSVTIVNHDQPALPIISEPSFMLLVHHPYWRSLLVLNNQLTVASHHQLPFKKKNSWPSINHDQPVNQPQIDHQLCQDQLFWAIINSKDNFI